MKFSLGFNKKHHKNSFTIAEPDRVWVEENYRWLTEVYGYTVLSADPVIFNEKFFPVSLSEKEVHAENIVTDLQSLLHLKDLNIRLDFWEDLRDTQEAPYEIQGKPFESGITACANHYQITVAKSLEALPGRLLFNITYQLVCIKLIEDALLDDSEADASLFVYLAGVYMGFGVILSRFLHEAGTSNNGLMETTWHYGPDIPYEVMAYVLAMYSCFSEQPD